MGAAPGYGAPTSAPPVGGGMPMGASPSAAGGYQPPMGGMGAPPTGAPPMGGAPPTQYGPPSGGHAPSPQTGGGVQFFSMAGGTPVAAQATAAPPMGMGGAMPPPPTATGAPPTAGMGIGPPPTMGPPGEHAPVTGAMPMPGAPTGFAGPAFVDKEGAGPGMHGQPAGGQMVALSDIDTSIRVNPAYMRSTVNLLPSTQAQGAGSRMPLGLVIRPMALDETDPDGVDVVDFGSTGIVRCKRCRTYINAYVSWTESGRRWRCNICGLLNDTPSSYFSHLDEKGRRRDRDQRPELSKATVEFAAPGEYMVRPPQTPTYVFVIDVSATAVASGMVTSVVNGIKSSIDNLPSDERTEIGFITFDSSIHFYSIKANVDQPTMLVVSELDDIILPSPADLLVNLHDCRSGVMSFLDSLPNMFQHNQIMDTCTGSALLAAQALMGHSGGKLCLFQSGLPILGVGALKPRENPRLIGTDREHMMLATEDAWYKNRAIEFSRLQICAELFVCTSQYCDLATLSVLPRYTAGDTYYYPGFFAGRDATRLETDIKHCLTRPTAFEAVFRVRCTRGVRLSQYYGNYFIRGTDLLALPNCSSDSTFGIDMVLDEQVLSTNVISVQSALLYTTAHGARRIRIHTMAIPVTANPQELVESADVDAIATLLAKQAGEIVLKAGLEQARARIHQACVDMLRDPRGMTGPYAPQTQQAPPPQSLQLLPLYSMSLQKNPAFRGGGDVRVDERSYYLAVINSMPTEEIISFIYPRMFSIHDMPNDAGVPAPEDEEDVLTAGADRIRLPGIVNLTHDKLQPDCVFLLDNACDLLMWVGRQVNPSIMNALFGVPSLEGVDLSQISLKEDSSDFTARLCAVIDAIRSERGRFQQLHIVREGDGPMQAFFARYLVEDRANFQGGTYSYGEYMNHVTRQAAGLPG